jgi:hypothetical protein
MTDRPYSPGFGSDSRHYVNGPGNGMSYDSGTLWPEMRLSSEADAKAAANCCNEAYWAGYAKAQRDMRAALGVA